MIHTLRADPIPETSAQPTARTKYGVRGCTLVLAFPMYSCTHVLKHIPIAALRAPCLWLARYGCAKVSSIRN
ncbi:MAG: hypothetical protein K0R08_1497 [Solimicrobium sp.]|jgi:hypothetical protein|nr:hypothetical protein [Solimicrobium sp.]